MDDELIIEVGADIGDADDKMSDLKGSIDDVGDAADDTGKKGGGLSGVFDVLGKGALVAGAGMVAFGGFLVGAAAAAAEEQQSIDRLNNALINNDDTWDAATDSIDRYINEQTKLAFSDDQVRDSLALLVTATKDVEEAVGLQELAMDLARAKNIDLAAATKLLVKADDESYAALGKLGIQIDKTATREEALAEIHRSTAGAAETYADSASGSMERAQMAMSDAFETIGAAVLSVVSGPLKSIADWFQSPEVQAGIQAVADAIGIGLTNAFTFIGDAIAVAIPIFQGILTALEPVFTFITENATPILIGLAGAITAWAIPALIAFAASLLTTVLPAFIATMAPILAAAAPFIAIGAAVGLLWLAFENNFLGIKDIVIGFWDTVSPILQLAWEWLSVKIGEGLAVLSELWNAAWPVIEQTLVDTWTVIQNAFTVAWPIIEGIITTGLQFVRDLWEAVWPGIQTTFTGVWDAISAAITIGWEIISGLWTTATALLSGDWEGAWEAIQEMFEGVWEGIQDLLQAGWDIIQGLWDTATGAIQTVWETVWGLIEDFVTDTWDSITGVVEDAWTGVETFMSDIGDGIKQTWDDLWGAVETFVTETWNTITTKFDEFWTFITGLPDKLLTEATNMGGAIIDGIMDGLGGMFDTIWNFIKGILSDVWQGIVDFFGGGGGGNSNPKGSNTGGNMGGPPNFPGAPNISVPHTSGGGSGNGWNGGGSGEPVVNIFLNGTPASVQRLQETLGFSIRVTRATT